MGWADEVCIGKSIFLLALQKSAPIDNNNDRMSNISNDQTINRPTDDVRGRQEVTLQIMEI